jgi:hypothetical protein
MVGITVDIIKEPLSIHRKPEKPFIPNKGYTLRKGEN